MGIEPKHCEVPLADAHFMGWVGPQRHAFVHGMQAQSDGEPRIACPYREKFTSAGHVTYSRSWRKAWTEGWDLAEERAREQEGERPDE